MKDHNGDPVELAPAGDSAFALPKHIWGRHAVQQHFCATLEIKLKAGGVVRGTFAVETSDSGFELYTTTRHVVVEGTDVPFVLHTTFGDVDDEEFVPFGDRNNAPFMACDTTDMYLDGDAQWSYLAEVAEAPPQRMGGKGMYKGKGPRRVGHTGKNVANVACEVISVRRIRGVLELAQAEEDGAFVVAGSTDVATVKYGTGSEPPRVDVFVTYRGAETVFSVNPSVQEPFSVESDGPPLVLEFGPAQKVRSLVRDGVEHSPTDAR